MEDLEYAIEESDYLVNIVTHNDPDGILSAAICIRALNTLDVEFDYQIFFESPSTIQKDESRYLNQDSDEFIGGFIILLDLPYHESASIWIDHHESETGTDTNPSTLYVVQDTRNSAATLTHKFFKDEIGVQENLVDINFLDHIDCRDIGNQPKVSKKEYELFSMCVFENRNDFRFFEKLVDQLVTTTDIGKITQDPGILAKAKIQKKKLKRGLKVLDDIISVETRNAFIDIIDKESDKETIDETKKRFFLFSKLLFFDLSDMVNYEMEGKHGISLPYFILDPELKKRNIEYFIFLVYRGDDQTGLIHCTISKNQVLDYKNEALEKLDLSEYAKEHGGGGHAFVSGFTIKPDRFLDVISETLDYMEKLE
ncbi:MAG: hypothetical protein ACFFCS_06985 [Candidatus Hodarchaeota archaeon]